MLLIVWDEVRTLIKTGVDGQRFESQLPFQNSKFRCLITEGNTRSRASTVHRISLQPVGPAATATISPLHRYFLPLETLSGGGGFFPPLVNVPSYDYYTNTLLDVTSIDPEIICDSRRLLTFGRSGWFSMSERR